MAKNTSTRTCSLSCHTIHHLIKQIHTTHMFIVHWHRWGSCLTVPFRLWWSTIPTGIPVVNIKHGFFWDFFSPWEELALSWNTCIPVIFSNPICGDACSGCIASVLCGFSLQSSFHQWKSNDLEWNIAWKHHLDHLKASKIYGGDHTSLNFVWHLHFCCHDNEKLLILTGTHFLTWCTWNRELRGRQHLLVKSS